MATFGSFVSGQILLASELNAAGAWTTFTPTLTGVNLGTGGTNSGQYSVFNKILFMRGKFVLGTGGSVTAGITIAMPTGTMAVSPTMQFQPNGSAVLTDSGVASYFAVGLQSTTSLLVLYVVNSAGTYATAVTTSATVPFTWAVNDYCEWAFTIQVA